MQQHSKYIMFLSDKDIEKILSSFPDNTEDYEETPEHRQEQFNKLIEKLKNEGLWRQK